MKKHITIGMSILLLAAAAWAAGTVHVVKKGETLTAISKKYHVPIAEILSYNGLKSSAAIKAGQKLKIPSKSAPVKPAAAKPAATAPAPKPEPVVTPTPATAMDTILPETASDTASTPAPAPVPEKRTRQMSTKAKFFILFVVQTIVSGLLSFLIAQWVVNRNSGGYKRGA